MKTFKELYEKLVSVTQRKKQARRMAKLAKSSAFQMKKKKAAIKMRDPAKLAQVARKQTIKTFRNKFYPGYDQMSLQQKVVVDQKIQQMYGTKIDKISKKAAIKLKAAEVERIKKAKERLRSDA
tara:strand:- start:2948 stop:3319 length:372 start_codon:yes stop_codon:yes gene_type:complete